MKTLLFTLLCLLGIQLSAFAQQDNSKIDNNNDIYVTFRMTASGGQGTKLARIVVEPFQIKKGSELDVHDLSKISQLIRIFEEDYGTGKVHAGYKNAYTLGNVASSHTDVNWVKQRATDWLESNSYAHIYSVTWQPPAKYTGVDPTNSTPVIKKMGESIKVNNSNTTGGGGITVEKKDTKFQEAEAKRILEAKKAEAQRQVKHQAIKNKAQADDIKRIQELNEAMKKRGRRQ